MFERGPYVSVIDSGEGSEHLKSGTKVAVAGAAALAIAVPLAPSASSAAAGHAQIKHVLLISVDGMHQSDLVWYVAGFRPDCGCGVRFMIKAGLVSLPPG